MADKGMTLGELARLRYGGRSDSWENAQARILLDARRAYGHVVGISDVECLIRAVSNLEHIKIERLDCLNLNGQQAARIAALEEKLARKDELITVMATLSGRPLVAEALDIIAVKEARAHAEAAIAAAHEDTRRALLAAREAKTDG